MKKIISVLTATVLFAMPSNVFALNIFSTGKNFLRKGANGGQKMESIIENSNVVLPIVDIGLTIGVVIAIVMGIFIGIKLLTSSVEGKVELKQSLTPYVVSIVVLFGAWTIWNIVLTVLQTTFN